MERKRRWEVISGDAAEKMELAGRFDEAQKAFDKFMQEATTKAAKLIDLDQAGSIVGQAFQLITEKVRRMPQFSDPNFQQMFDKARSLDEQHVGKAKGVIEEVLGKGAVASLQMATPLGLYAGPLIGQTDRFIVQQLAEKHGSFVLHEKKLLASLGKDVAQGKNIQVEYVKGLAITVGMGADRHRHEHHHQHLRQDRQKQEKERDFSRSR